jgi:hypothetical protein
LTLPQSQAARACAGGSVANRAAKTTTAKRDSEAGMWLPESIARVSPKSCCPVSASSLSGCAPVPRLSFAAGVFN